MRGSPAAFLAALTALVGMLVLILLWVLVSSSRRKAYVDFLRAKPKAEWLRPIAILPIFFSASFFTKENLTYTQYLLRDTVMVIIAIVGLGAWMLWVKGKAGDQWVLFRTKEFEDPELRAQARSAAWVMIGAVCVVYVAVDLLFQAYQ